MLLSDNGPLVIPREGSERNVDHSMAADGTSADFLMVVGRTTAEDFPC